MWHSAAAGRMIGPTDAECLAMCERTVAGHDALVATELAKIEEGHRQYIAIYKARMATRLAEAKRDRDFYASRVNKAA